MYLMFPDTTALAEIGIAVARAYMPDAGLVGLDQDDVGHGRAAPDATPSEEAAA